MKRKGFGKRLLSMLLTVVMIVGMFPMSALAVEAPDGGEKGWVWNGTTLYIKDGQSINLYDALCEQAGTPAGSAFRYDVKDHSYRWYRSGTRIASGASAALTHNQTYYAVQVTGKAFGQDSCGDAFSFTVKHYCEVETAVATGSPENAGISAEYSNVEKGTSVKITVNNVDGYTASVTDSKGNAVGNLDAYSPEESTTLTVAYTSEEVTKYSIAVEEVNGEWGTALLKSEAELPAGSEALIEVIPNTNDDSHRYAITSVEVDGVELSRNANGYYVYTMGEEDATVVVTFNKTALEIADGTEVGFNGWYQDGTVLPEEELAELKGRIFDLLDTDVLPAGATEDSVSIQYYPWYKGAITGGWSHDGVRFEETLHDLNASPDGHTGYTGAAFGARAYKDGATIDTADYDEKIRIAYDGLYLDVEVTLTEAREEYEVIWEATAVSYDEQAEIDAAVQEKLEELNTDCGAITSGMANDQILPGGGQTKDLTYNVTVQDNAKYLGTTATVEIAATANSQPANVTIASEGTGEVSVNFGGLTADGSLIGGTHTLTVTPADLDGSDGSAMYVEEVRVTGGTLTGGSWNNGVYTAEVTIANDTDVTVTVVYGTESLVNRGGTLELNGYHTSTNYSARYENIKANIINAVLGGGTVSDYNVQIWIDPRPGDPRYFNLDDTSLLGDWNWLTVSYPDRLNVPAYGETGSLKVKIVKAASSDGKIVELTLTDAVIPTKESREPAAVSLGTIAAGPFNTEDEFKTAVTNAISVLDNNNADCKASAGLSVTLSPVEGKEKTYTVSYSLSKDGASWLTNSGAFDGEVVWNVTTHTVVFKDYDGSEIGRQTVEHGKAAEAPTATQEYKTEDKVYTFKGWDAAFDNITANTEVTAQYSEATRYYTVTFVNEDGTELQKITDLTYNAVPAYTEETPVKASTNTETYTFKDWDKEIAAVTEDNVVYTATYESATRYYTVTFVDYDGTELGTSEVEYGAAATAPADPVRAADETYTYAFTGWDTEFDSITADGVVVTATYAPSYINYSVTWMADGVIYAEKTDYHYGDTIEKPADPEKAGNNFVGWDVDGDGAVADNEVIPATVTGTVTFTAVFDPLPVYTVTVQYGNGTEDYTYTIIEGNPIAVPAAPVREGYRFMGWQADGAEFEGVASANASVTITAQWSELFTITWINDGAEYQVDTDAYIAGETPAAPAADPTKAADAEFTYEFDRWDPAVDAITGDTTYTAQYSTTTNGYTVKFVDADGNLLDEQTVDYGTMPEYKGEASALVKEYYSCSWTPALETVTGNAEYKLVWTANNDANNNGIADELETGTVTVTVTGNGTVTLTPAGAATLVNQEGNVYTYLYDSTNDANKVINVAAAPIDTDATDGNVDYLISAPATVHVGETVTAAFGTHTLNASGGEFGMNGYYEARANMGEIIKTLKADILNAAGLDGTKADAYKVEMVYRLGKLDVDMLTGNSNILNATAFFTAIESLPENRQFVITDKETGVSKTVTHKIVESRPSAGLTDYTETEAQAQEYDSQDALTAYVNGLANGTAVNPKGLAVSVSTKSTWPTVAGVATQMVYTVKYAATADYLAGEAAITVYVKTKHSNCTVMEDAEGAGMGSVTVNGTAADSAAVTVAGNSTVTVEVTPSGSNVVESIVIKKNGTAVFTFNTEDISYKNKKATVSFKTDGSQQADEYTVAATYSESYLNLKTGQTIEYCVEDKTIDITTLDALVWDAVFESSSAPMTKDNSTIEFKTTGVSIGDLGWVELDEAFDFAGLGHKFGENGSETIRVTYEDAKYGKLQKEATLNVHDSCYSVIVNVNTVTNGADAAIKAQYSADTRAYKGAHYFKQDTDLTVTLTPDGKILEILGRMYNGTYAEQMAYIESVTVTDQSGNPVQADVVRGRGKLDLSNMDGLGDLWNQIQNLKNLSMYNAAVTFTLKPDEVYTVTVEYGIHKLEKKAESVQLPMYQGGKDYAAEVPTSQELINAILGETEAAEFLATYGGAYTVEFSADLINYNWAEVSDEALLALRDGAKIKVRITWKAAEGDMTYYPVAATAEVTLVDRRTATSVAGENTGKQVNFLSEDKLITELKEALGLGIQANGAALDVAYDVTYTMKGNETDGLYVNVTVSYDGSAEYKPISKTFENVPVANRPDDTIIKVSGEGVTELITNNDGKPQTAADGVYAVVGNGTYVFKFTPAAGKAIDAVKVNGEAVVLKYSEQTATFSMLLTEKETYEVTVETVDSAFVPDDTRVYDFAYGIMDPVSKDVVDAAIKTPTAGNIDYEKVEIEYLARAEGNVPVTLPDIDLGFTVIELGSFDVELGELWLEPGAEIKTIDLDKAVEELVTDVVNKVTYGELPAAQALTYIQNKLKSMTIGAHVFGEGGDGSVETIRVSYEDEKYLLAECKTDVTIHDYRSKTELRASDCGVTFGYSLKQLIAAAGAEVIASGASTGKEIKTDDLYLHADSKAKQITLYFEGDQTYQPCQTTINVVVNKAECSIDYDSQTVTYGEDYSLALSISPSKMADGTTPDIDRIEFMIGLDASKLLDVDFEDKDVGLNQATGEIRLRLPQTIRDLPLVGEYLQTDEDGVSIGEFTDMIKGLDDILGIDDNSMSILNKVVEAITGISDNLDIRVIVRDEDFHPTEIGVYIAGAVTVDADFKTAYTADYLIIAPATVECTLAWNYSDSNGIMTLPAYQQTFKDQMGAHVVETATMTGNTLKTANSHVKYLILGISDESSDFLTTDVYGNIKASIWTSCDAITDNGAYVQIAYMLNWGNEIYYAVPIVRSFLVVPQPVRIELEGADEHGVVMQEFDNTPKNVNVKVYKQSGEEVQYTKDELSITYVGMQTNTTTYNSSEAPTHAGAYAVIATYMNKDENGDVQYVGVNAGVLVITPTEATVEVGNVIIKHENKTATTHNIAEHLGIKAGSTVPNLVPDTTVIVGSIATTGDFSENGWDAVAGNVNVDFPNWVDELLKKHAPGIYKGMTPAEFNTKVTAKIPDIIAKLEAAVAENGSEADLTDLEDALIKALGEVQKIVDRLPENITLTFHETEDLTAQGIGAYVVVAIVTDSDHHPAVDAGILAIVPDVDLVHLAWDYQDENGIFTHELLQIEGILNATAYDDAAHTIPYTDKDVAITYQFIGTDPNGNLVVTNNAADLNNGAYVELAYVEFEVAGEMVISDLIARPVLIIPNVVNVEIKDANNNGILYREFNNQAHPIEIEATYEGSVITVDKENLTVTYAGIQTNGEAYKSTQAPKHAGTYLVTVMYIHRNANGTVVAAGGDAATLIISPTTAQIDVAEKIVTIEPGKDYALSDLVTVASKVANIRPDTTVITASIHSDGTFSDAENAWSAVQGNVNVDFPRWVDEILAQYVPSVKDGITASEFAALINGKLPAISEKLTELGIDADAVDMLNKAIERVNAEIAKIPDNATLTFKDGVVASNVGVYLITAVVTDSDHYPAADSGIFVLVPSVTTNHLKFNYNDANGIYTKYLLKEMMADPDDMLDMEASAYTDAKFSQFNETATAMVKNVFLAVNEQMQIVVTDDWTTLTDGVYIQMSYIPLEAASAMQLSNLIARPVVVTPNMVEVSFVGGRDQSAVQTGSPITMDDVKVIGPDGKEIQPKEGEVTIRYQGVATNGTIHNSTTGPVHTGVYVVIASYLDDENNAGVCIGSLTVTPADVKLTVDTPVLVEYGEDYEITVIHEPATSDAKYLMLTGGIDATIASMEDLDIMDMDSIIGAINTVNLDFPAAADKIISDVLNKLNLNVGTLTIGDFTTAIEEICDLLAKIDYSSEDLNQIVAMLSKMDQDVPVTFEDNCKPANVGLYVMLPVVMDPDYKTNVNKDGMGMLMIVSTMIEATVVSTSGKYEYKLGDELLNDWTYEITDGALVGEDVLAAEYVIKDADGNVVTEITEIGTYTVEAVFAENVNYMVTMVPATLTITEAEKISYQVKNHTGEPDEHTWKITADEEDHMIHVRNDDDACVVVLEHTDGTYTRLTATQNADGSYDYDISAISDGDYVVIAKKGDLNLDGEVRSNEITMVRAMLLGKIDPANELQRIVADVNGDGELRSNEVTQIRAAVLGKLELNW